MTRFAEATPAEPLRLAGDARARGRAQAAAFPGLVPRVAEAMTIRLADPAAAVDAPATRAWIADLHRWTERHYPAILDEIEGLAEGFGVPAERIFAYLNASHAADFAMGASPTEGCTALASGGPTGAVVAKCRDYRPEHVALQKVFHHVDPAWGGRSFLCVGSLGSPGNFSSGMNSDGLAVADTASRVNAHAVGMHRYFLLTWLLVECRSVAEALEAIRGMPHAGSGLLVMGDASGAVAAVELGPGHAVGIEVRQAGTVARSNHFLLPETRGFNLDTPETRVASCNSDARAAALAALLPPEGPALPPGGAAGVLARHAGDGSAFCRHGGADISTTISGTVYACGVRSMTFAAGNPCTAPWRRYTLAPAA